MGTLKHALKHADRSVIINLGAISFLYERLVTGYMVSGAKYQTSYLHKPSLLSRLALYSAHVTR